MLLQFIKLNVPCDNKSEVNVGCCILVDCDGRLINIPFLLYALNPKLSSVEKYVNPSVKSETGSHQFVSARELSVLEFLTE